MHTPARRALPRRTQPPPRRCFVGRPGLHLLVGARRRGASSARRQRRPRLEETHTPHVVHGRDRASSPPTHRSRGRQRRRAWPVRSRAQGAAVPGKGRGLPSHNSLPRRTCDPLRRHESEIDRTRLTSGDDDVESKCHRGVGRGEGRCPKDQRAIRWTHGYRRDPQRCREEPLIVRGCASAAFRCEDGRRTRRNRSKTCFGAAPNKRLAGSVGQRHVIHRSRSASPSSQHGSCTDTRTSQPW